MHAIGNLIRSRRPGQSVAYTSSEKFMNELVNAIRFEQLPDFRDRYRSIDVLLIDDIQFLAGKERTQEEFFHTFNALYDGQKQIVISSDRTPKEIPTIEERLQSRFEWGLIADIQPPDLETKIAILKRKADEERVVLGDDVAMYIAGQIKSNIRELEGSLIRLVAFASMSGRSIDLALSKEVLASVLSRRGQEVDLDRIMRAVAENYGLSTQDLLSRSNTHAIAHPRQVAMYLAKKLTALSFPQIGKAFGGKHHTTVMHSVSKVEETMDDDAAFRRNVQGLIDALR
jgi:chromosomal replication initiator protein